MSFAAIAAGVCVTAGATVGLVACNDKPGSSTLEPWQQKWAAHQTRWHQNDPNPFLLKYLEALVGPTTSSTPGMGPRVLVPLCGKTVDMAFLARKGYRVVGVEGVGQAIDEFAEEHALKLPHGGYTMRVNLPPPFDSTQEFKAVAMLITAAEDEPVRNQAAPPVLLVEGDFLKIGPREAEALVPFDAAFDRGSLVAVSPKDREQYAQALSDLIMPQGKVLVVACEHEPFTGGKLGPPFQVTEAELGALFGAKFDIKLLCREDAIDSPPGGMRDRGINEFYECVYLMTKRPLAAI